MLPVACELFNAYWDMSVAMEENASSSWGDGRTRLLHLIHHVLETKKMNSGHMRVLSPDGEEKEHFHPRGI